MKIIGHRGAKGLAPENTLASIDKALLHDVDELEIDVRTTSDGVVILMHDKTLLRVAGRLQLIRNTSYASLKEIKPDTPTLDEVIRHIDRRVPLRIEVKSRVPAKSVTDIVQNYLDKGWKAEDFLFASFHQNTLCGLQKALPQIQVAVNGRYAGLWAMHRARQLGTKKIAMKKAYMWAGYIRYMSRSRYELTVYTMNDPGKTARWARSGLTSIVTDYPDRFIPESHDRT